MGGYGSSRWGWHRKRYTVDEALSFGASWLCRRHILGPDVYRVDGLRWTYATGHACDVALTISTGPTSGTLRLAYGFRSDPDHPEAYDLALETTRPYFGGLRWWIVCPRCGRRCDKLYLPPGARRFACRVCHDLAYRSSQEHNKTLDRYKGASPDDLRAMMDGGDTRAAMWAIEASYRRMERIDRLLKDRA